MIKFTTTAINIFSFFITVILCSILNFAGDKIQEDYKTTEEIQYSNIQNENKILNTNVGNIEKNNEKNIKNTKKNDSTVPKIEFNWGIAIPKIDVNAPISEGTTMEVMNKFVGHFSDTGVIKGNICLGAHNRGYPINYFQNIKSLKKGDLIYYKKDEKIFKFKVRTVEVIRDTDWTRLEQTEDNRITLITCVEDEPDYRRCIQAVEVKGGK